MDNYLIDKAAAEMVQTAREQSRISSPKVRQCSQLRTALRNRRKVLLGTHLSVRSLVQTNHSVDENKISVLSRYLASRSAFFWSIKRPGNEEFCFHFYRLSLWAIGGGKIRPESIDDIIELADCLSRSRDTFSIAMQDILPEALIPDLFDLVDIMTKDIYLPAFPDAVLSGIATLSGYMADPLADEAKQCKDGEAE